MDSPITLDATSESGTPEEAELGEVTVDTSPPVIKLLGNGTLTSLPESPNVTVMVHRITTLDTWQDPGVIAIDETFGDLTRIVEASGPKQIDTTTPTDLDEPHTFEYRVKDPMGNEGVARRELHISCPQSAVLCEDLQLQGLVFNVTKRSCGLLGACDMNQAFMLGGAEPETPPDEASRESSMLSLAMTQTARNAPLPSMPIIELLGPSVVVLPQGAAYSSCTPSSPPDEACDRGALAYSTTHGDLTHQILVCALPELKMQLQRDRLLRTQGLAPCGINTTIPGNWSVTFSVQSAQDPSAVANVTRTLVIPPSCDAGERLCSDLRTCSQDLVCAYDIFGPQLSTFDSIMEDETTRPQTPVLSLLGPAMVDVRQGSLYAPCNPGRIQQDACDPGAVIVGQSSTESALAVLALAGSFPATRCLSESCLGAQFSSRGLSGTGLNTSAPVGTQFVIQFAIVDASALAVVTVNRTVFIAHPCVNKEDFLCGDGACSPVECGLRDLLLGVGTEGDQEPPSLTLRGDAELVVPYGATALPGIGSLLPCQDISIAECGAVASDSQGNDISSSISIREVTNCSATSGGNDCLSCAPSQLTSGVCLPGQYRYRYEVVDSNNGRSASRDRLVLVTETGVLRLTLLFGSSSQLVQSLQQAEELAAALNRQDSAPGLALTGAIQTALDEAALQLEPFQLDGFQVERAQAYMEQDGITPVLEVTVEATVFRVASGDGTEVMETTEDGIKNRRLLVSDSQPASLPDALGAFQTTLQDSISAGKLSIALHGSKAYEFALMELQNGPSRVSASQSSPPVNRDMGMLVSNISSAQQSIDALTGFFQPGAESEIVEEASMSAEHLYAPGSLAGSFEGLLVDFRGAMARVDAGMMQAEQAMAWLSHPDRSRDTALGQLTVEMEEAIAYMDRRIKNMEATQEFLDATVSSEEQQVQISCPASDSELQGTYRLSFTADSMAAAAGDTSSIKRWVLVFPSSAVASLCFCHPDALICLYPSVCLLVYLSVLPSRRISSSLC